MENLPRAFGPYLLLDHAGRGGMGDVFLARTGLLVGFEKYCVVKMLRADHSTDAEAMARFTDEARVVVQLSHRNICPVFDVGRVGGGLYVAMEHIVGRDLRTLSHVASVPIAIAVHIVCEVLEALDYAHRFQDVQTGAPLGLVHRDVSPHNVLLGVDGDTKLIDFGIAVTRARPDVGSGDTVLGKLTYMSPEHARGAAVDGRADEFSAAIMLAELVVNRPFHEGRTNQQIWEDSGSGTWRPPWWGTIDDGLRALLDRALSPSGEDRYPTCGDFVDALLAWARATGNVAGPRDVRQLLQRSFGDLTAEHRATLLRVREAPPVMLPGSVDDDSQQFESIATTLALPGPTPAFGNLPGTLVLRPRPETPPTPPSSPFSWSSSKLKPLIAAAAAVAALLTMVILTSDAADEERVVTLPDEPVTADAGVVVVLVPPPPAPPVEPVIEVPVLDVALAALDPIEKKGRLVRADRPDRPDRADRADRPDRPDKGPADVALDAETRSAVAYLKDCIDKVPCARGMLDWSRRKLSASEHVERKGAILDCAKRCRLR